MNKENMVTMRDYARQHGISYEAVRKQVAHYQKELAGHTTKQNRVVYMDEYCVRFLDEHRLQRTIIIEPTEEETQNELDRLRAEIDLLRNELVREKDRIIQLQDEKMELIEYKAKTELLLEDKAAAIERAEKAEREAESYYKSILGFYRKRT